MGLLCEPGPNCAENIGHVRKHKLQISQSVAISLSKQMLGVRVTGNTVDHSVKLPQRLYFSDIRTRSLKFGRYSYAHKDLRNQDSTYQDFTQFTALRNRKQAAASSEAKSHETKCFHTQTQT